MRYIILFAFVVIWSGVGCQILPKPNTPFQVPVRTLRPYAADSLQMIVPIYQVGSHWVWGLMHRDTFLQGIDDQCLSISETVDSIYLKIDNCPDSVGWLKSTGGPGLNWTGLANRIAVWDTSDSLSYRAWYVDPYTFGIRNTASEWPYLKESAFTFTTDTLSGLRKMAGNGDIAITKGSQNYGILQVDGSQYIGFNPALENESEPENMSWVMTASDLYNQYNVRGHNLYFSAGKAYYSFLGDSDTGIGREGINILGIFSGSLTNPFQRLNGGAGLWSLDPDMDGSYDITADNTYMRVEQLLVDDKQNNTIRLAGFNTSEFVTDLIIGGGITIDHGVGTAPDTISVTGSPPPSELTFEALCPPDYLVGTNAAGDTLSQIAIHLMEQGEFYTLKDTRVLCDSLITKRGSHFDYYEYQPWNKTLSAGVSDTIRINNTGFEFDFDIVNSGEITLQNSEQEQWEAITLAAAPYGLTNYTKIFGINGTVTIASTAEFYGRMYITTNGSTNLNCQTYFTVAANRPTAVPISCMVELSDGDNIQVNIQSDMPSGSNTLTFRRANINGHHIKTKAFPNF